MMMSSEEYRSPSSVSSSSLFVSCLCTLIVSQLCSENSKSEDYYNGPSRAFPTLPPSHVFSRRHQRVVKVVIRSAVDSYVTGKIVSSRLVHQHPSFAPPVDVLRDHPILILPFGARKGVSSFRASK